MNLDSLHKREEKSKNNHVPLKKTLSCANIDDRNSNQVDRDI